MPLPPNWNGPVFHLSQNYPSQVAPDTYPWMSYDPAAQPDQYLAAVLQYCLDGNSAVDWVLQNNTVRGWYRRRGCTGERTGRANSRIDIREIWQPGELAPQQTSSLQNWHMQECVTSRVGIPFGELLGERLPRIPQPPNFPPIQSASNFSLPRGHRLKSRILPDQRPGRLISMPIQARAGRVRPEW